jgi:hypothetical protein
VPILAFQTSLEPAVSDEERDHRSATTRRSRHSLRLEGLKPSAYALEQSDKWVAGEITYEEYLERVLAHVRRSGRD